MLLLRFAIALSPVPLCAGSALLCPARHLLHKVEEVSPLARKCALPLPFLAISHALSSPETETPGCGGCGNASPVGRNGLGAAAPRSLNRLACCPRFFLVMPGAKMVGIAAATSRSACRSMASPSTPAKTARTHSQEHGLVESPIAAARNRVAVTLATCSVNSLRSAYRTGIKFVP